jgi:hypothetical protein
MNELLPSTDNFFKYLLTIGLLLIVFTIMYPIQKQKEVDLEILNYNSSVDILNLRIVSLEKNVTDLEKTKVTMQLELDSLKQLKETLSPDKAKVIESIRVEKKEEFDRLKKDLINVADSLLVGRINVDNTKEKIKKLNSYFSFFVTYKIVFLVVGIFFSFFGFRYWIASAYLEELKKGKELQLPNQYKSSFVRHIEICKGIFTRSWVIIFTVVLTLVLVIMIYYFCL